MCVLSIELAWVEIYGKKMEKNHHFLAFSRFGTSTKQCGIRTTCVLVNWYRYRKVSTGTQCSVLDQH